MYCSSCGIEIPEDARFCSGCGKPTSPTPESSASVDVESEKPKKKEWSAQKKAITALLLVVTFVTWVFLAATEKEGKSVSRTKAGKSVSRQVMPGDLELLNSELTMKAGKHTYEITGRIKNTSAARDAEIAISTTKTISSLQIFFQLYDATGNQVGKAMDICCADVTPKREPSLETANLLMPGDTWNVIASDLGSVKRANKKAVSFRFDKITADLGGISHKTVPLTNLPSGLRVPFRSKLTPEQRKSGVYTDEDVLREVSKRRDSLKKRIQKAADRASRSMGKR